MSEDRKRMCNREAMQRVRKVGAILRAACGNFVLANRLATCPPSIHAVQRRERTPGRVGLAADAEMRAARFVLDFQPRC